MNKTLLAVAMSALAAAAHADIVQSWRAVVIPNPTDPNVDADPAFAPPSTGTTLDVHPGESILFVWSVFVTDTEIPAAASAAPGSVLRGLAGATSQLRSTTAANGVWRPVDSTSAGVYNSNGSSGIAAPATATFTDSFGIKGLAVLSNGLITGTAGPASGIRNAEGVDILGIIWTPQSYSPHATTFVGSPFGAPNDNVLIYRNGDVASNRAGFIAVPATGSSSFTINIIPAPASLSLFAFAALIARRRR